jgi:uncharacterized phage protein (TIGR01671 family)
MRTIKFRAWDKENGIMVLSSEEQDWYTFGFEKGVLKCWNTWEEPESYEEPAHIDSEELDTPLMQFTGLLDRNGKEIYEGDVVYADRNKKRYEIQIGAYDSEDDESDEHSHFGVHGKEMGEHWREEMGMSEKYVEVIGNIYENPELLGEKK